MLSKFLGSHVRTVVVPRDLLGRLLDDAESGAVRDPPRKLHCFRSYTDHVIAYDEEDAFAVIAETYGELDAADWRKQVENGEWEWAKRDPAMLLKFNEKSDEHPGVEKTIGEWILQEGRGFLCSTEW